MKECIDCHEIKELTEFYTQKSIHNGKLYINYLKYCKLCKVKFHNWTKIKTKEQARKNRLKFKYNLTIEQYQELYKQQNGNCAICKRDLMSFKKNPAIDHDHITGKVRGLLCNNCNSGIGLLKDNYKICLDAAMYLKYHSDETTD